MRRRKLKHILYDWHELPWIFFDLPVEQFSVMRYEFGRKSGEWEVGSGEWEVEDASNNKTRD